MRVISISRLREFWSQPKHRTAEPPLRRWYRIAAEAAWRSSADVKATFGANVDFVEVRRTRTTVAVLDAGGNRYRLVAAIHYVADHPARGRLYLLRVMDHAEYDRMKWADEL